MKTVSEVSKLSGVSVRALHHYDAVGWLKPTATTESGYRLYDEKAIEKLQTILMFREMAFSLREIAEIVNRPGFDVQAALKDHIAMLELQKRRIEGLIALAENRMKGTDTMSFRAFDKRELEKYEREAKERWGKSEAYREYEVKKPGADFAAALTEKFAEFGKLKEQSADGKEVQEKVEQLQQFITENCYTCTKEILSGLGEMYIADERFRANIDAAGGEGTAEFVSRAIKEYCR